jgi:hypothetical protein
MKDTDVDIEAGKTPFSWRLVRMAGLIVGGVALAAFFALVLGVVVQWLWNWLMPDIFGFKEISYWQAFGLLFLSRLLFGTLGRHGRGHRPHRAKRWVRGGTQQDYGKYHRHFWRECGEVSGADQTQKAKTQE